MRCVITAYSKSNDISALQWHGSVTEFRYTDFCMYAKENGQPWMLKSECSSHMNQLNCFSCCSVC